MSGWSYIPSAADVHHLAILVMSVMGIVTYGYTFAYHFFHVVVGRDILARALQVITAHLFFALCIAYCRTLFSLAFQHLWVFLTLSLYAQSVTKNASTLLWVAALIAIIIYIYSLAAFAWLRRDFSADHNLLFCDSAWEVGLNGCNLSNGLNGCNLSNECLCCFLILSKDVSHHLSLYFVSSVSCLASAMDCCPAWMLLQQTHTTRLVSMPRE
jgi:hypothetical protein